MSAHILVETKNLKTYFPAQRSLFGTVKKQVHAVDGVSISIPKGKTLGLVGESGCGKSTLGKTILQLIRPTAGEIFFSGQNVLGTQGKEMRALRKQMQIIFQDPYASLNPRMTVEEILAEPFAIHHKGGNGTPVKEQITNLLDLVGLQPEYRYRYPHEFSGGQRQRIGIARALALKPSFVVADEPVSALDVSIQAQILNLLQDLKNQFNLTFLFISHDLAVIEHISDEVAVMYLGRIVERAAAERIYSHPSHPYTKMLIEAIPKPNPQAVKKRRLLKGDLPSPLDPPSGCTFHPRCPLATEVCQRIQPELKTHNHNNHFVACHHADKN